MFGAENIRNSVGKMLGLYNGSQSALILLYIHNYIWFHHTHILELISSNSKLESLPRYFEQIFKLMLLVWARECQFLSKITHGKYGDFLLLTSYIFYLIKQILNKQYCFIYRCR